MAFIVVRRWEWRPPQRNDRSKVWFWVGAGLLALVVIGCLSDRNRPVTVVQPVPVQQVSPWEAPRPKSRKHKQKESERMSSTTIGLRKIDFATSAFERLLQNFFRWSIDRAAVISAGNEGLIECGFTSDLTALKSAIRRLTHTKGDEKTCLWDTVVASTAYYRRAGRRNVPWVELVVSDGGDNASVTYKKDPVRAGHFVYDHFTREPSNYLALVGVGEDKQIDKQALEKFAIASNCVAIAIKDFSLLGEMFLSIAVQITSGLAGVRYSAGNLSWTELERMRHVVHVPIDLALVIDRSGSMYNA
jgi:hypothetical protein